MMQSTYLPTIRSLLQLRHSPVVEDRGIFYPATDASALVVFKVGPQCPSRSPLAQNDDVVQTLPPNRANQPLAVRVLRGDCDAVGTSSVAMALAVLGKDSAVDSITIAEPISWSAVPGSTQRLDER